MPQPPLDIRLEYVDRVAVLALAGVVDAATIEQVRRALEPLCENPAPRILLDCTNLHFINSLGFGLFFKLSQMCKQRQGRLVLAGVCDKLRGVFKVLGLEKLVDFYPTPAEALALMGKG